MKKGTQVRIVRGKARGQQGTVFWSGPSRYGPGLRLGITTADGTKVWAAADQVQPADGAASYPYRFYGHGCAGGWIEGAEDGHCFTVQFSREPSQDELSVLGEAYAASLKKGAARPSHQPWEWSGRWALFEVGERGQGGGPPIVAAVQRFLDEAHSLVPIVDVVYFNAREGTDGWDDWSSAQGPPDAGPFPLTQAGLFPRPHDPALPQPARSEAFEAGRQAEAYAKELAKITKAIDKQGKKAIRVEPLAADGLPERPTSFAWPDTELTGFDIPEPAVLRHENPPGNVWHEFQTGDHPLRDVAGRRLAWRVPEAGQAANDLVWLDDEGKRHTPRSWKPPIVDARLDLVLVHPAAHYAVLSVNRMEYLEVKAQVLYRVSFDDGEARAIYTCNKKTDGPLGRVAFVLGGDRIAVATAKRIFLLDPEAKKPRALSPVKHGGGPVHVVFDGSALLAETTQGWRIHGLTPKTIKAVGTVAVPVRFAFEHEGRLLLEAAGQHFELIGARAAVERFRSKAAKG